MEYNMTNIFNDIKFGDKFLTKDAIMVIYHRDINIDDKSCRQFFEETNLEPILYDENGKCVNCSKYGEGYDIVEKYQEPVSKEQIIQGINGHKEYPFDICEKFYSEFSYKDRKNVILLYKFLKSCFDYLKCVGVPNEKYYEFSYFIDNFEKSHQIFEPSFTDNLDKFIPEEMKDNVRNIFKFRKNIFYTQDIWHDKELDDIIISDMGYIWGKKSGQDGMYDAFPFSFSRRSIVRKNDYYNDYLNSNCHSETELIRSYALDSCGGIAIIIERTRSHYDKPEIKDGLYENQKIVTLGEDDAYHFLNSRHIYEDNYGDTDDFFGLLNMVKEESIKELKK